MADNPENYHRVTPEVEDFLRAAKAKNVDKCAALLGANPEMVNSVEAGGFSALHFAAFNGDLEMIKMLFDHKASVDLENHDRNTPLVMAVKGDQVEAIRLLVHRGADVNHASGTGATAAHHAAAMGRVHLVRELVKLGFPASQSSTMAGSLLHWAVQSGDVNCVGAMIYEFKIPVDIVDSHGGTALLMAISLDNEDIVQFLLEHGADVNVCVPEDGTTALHIAAAQASYNSVKLLRTLGADASRKNQEGQTPADVTEDNAVRRELAKEVLSPEERAKEALRFKEQGNKVFSAGENVKAARFYSLSIQLDRENHVYFSNRAAAYYKRKDYLAAFWDSKRCVLLAPTWSRGYFRLGTTELALRHYEDAVHTADEGLKHAPSDKDLLALREEGRRAMAK